MDWHKKDIWPVIFLTAGLFIRLVYGIFFAPPLNVPSGDAVGYDILGYNLVQYHQLAYEKDKPTAHREPGYPLFLAMVYLIFGHSVIAVRIFQALLGVVSCYLIYLLTRDIFGRAAAGISLIIAVIYPAFIYYTAALLRETFFTFLLLLTVWFVNKKYILATAVLLALLGLTNSVSLLFVLAILLIYLWQKQWRFLIVTLVVFLLVYGFWPLRNYQVFKKVIIGSTNGGATFLDGTDIIPWEIRGQPSEEEFRQKHPVYLEAQKISGEVERDRYYFRVAVEYIKKHPGHYLLLTLRKYLKLWNFYPRPGASYGHSPKLLRGISLLSYGPVFGLAIIGLFIFPLKKIFVVVLPLLIFPLVYALFWSQIRYRLPLEPYLIILASGTLAHIFKNKLLEKEVKQ